MSAGNPNADPGMPQGFFLSGDAEAMAAMTPDRVEMLRVAAGNLGLTLTVQYDDSAPVLHAESEPTPVLASRDDLVAFALENGYTEHNARLAWSVLRDTRDPYRRTGYVANPQPLPVVQFVVPEPPYPESPRGLADAMLVNVSSIAARLRATGPEPAKWYRAGIKYLSLITLFTNHRLELEEPFPLPESGTSTEWP